MNSLLKNSDAYRFREYLHPFTQTAIMDHYHETFRTWNKIAQVYQDKFMDLDLYDHTYDAFCEALPDPHSRVLDIGCGPGNITRYLLAKKPGFRIEGLDVAPNMVELAQKNNPAARFAVMDVRDIRRLEGGFDAIICGFCLPYLSETDVEKLIDDCAGLLTENGVLYLSLVEGDKERSGYISNSSGDQVYFYYHSLENLEVSLSAHNFERLHLFHVPYEKSEGQMETHTAIICRKHTK